MSATGDTSSSTLIATVMAVLVCAEVAVMASGLDDAPRYGIGAVIVVALVVGAYRLGRSRRAR